MLLTTDSMKLSLCSSTSPPPALASWLTRPVTKSGSIAARASMRSTFPVASSGWSGPIFRTFSDLETFNRGPRCVRSSRGSSTPATSCGVRLYSESVTDFPAAICVAPCAQPHMGVNMTASHHGQVGKITQKLHFVWPKIVLCMGLFFVFFGRSDHSCPHPLFGPAAEQNPRRTLGRIGLVFRNLKLLGVPALSLGLGSGLRSSSIRFIMRETTTGNGDTMAAPIKFGVGQSVLPKEDDALIRGQIGM